MSFTLGLVVHAVNLPHERDRIMASLEELGPLAKRVQVALVTEKDYKDGDMAKFNPAMAKNIGLRKLLPTCEGIVCVDTDHILCPGLFDLLAESVMQPFHVWIRRRDISEEEYKRRAWGEWMKLPVFAQCWGSGNYLSRANWLKVGGWEERCYGWGGEDDCLLARIAGHGIQSRKIDGLPHMHINHDNRPWAGANARGAENFKWASVPQPNYLTTKQ